MEHRGKVFFWGVVAFGVALLVAGLGKPPLMDPDEARFARTSVEMTRSRDLAVPTFEGTPRVVKPPLIHWLQAVLFQSLGVGELPARLPSALATLGSLLLVAWVARRRFGEEGAAWAGAIFVTLPLVVVEGRMGTTDALLSVHVMAAVAMDMAEPDGTGRQRDAAIGALLGLAFLAKGPVGILLPLLMILAGRTASGRNVVPEWRSVGVFLAGWSVVALPWALAFTQRVGVDRALGTLRHEVVDRYFAGTAHVEPSWYYAAILFAGFFPWVTVLGVALVRVLGLRKDPAARTALYAAAALVAGLFFLSLGRGKLPQYILPLAPMVALLLTWELSRELEAPRERTFGPILLTGTLFVTAIVLAAVGAVRREPEAGAAGYWGAALYTAGGLNALWGMLRQRPRQVYGSAAAAAGAFLLACAFVLHPALGRDRSARPLLAKVPGLLSDRPVVLVDIRLPSITFYLDRVPERVRASELSDRLSTADAPLVVVAEVDLPRLPSAATRRLRRVAVSGKLNVFEEISTARADEAQAGGAPDANAERM